MFFFASHLQPILNSPIVRRSNFQDTTPKIVDGKIVLRRLLVSGTVERFNESSQSKETIQLPNGLPEQNVGSSSSAILTLITAGVDKAKGIANISWQTSNGVVTVTNPIAQGIKDKKIPDQFMTGTIDDHFNLKVGKNASGPTAKMFGMMAQLGFTTFSPVVDKPVGIGDSWDLKMPAGSSGTTTITKSEVINGKTLWVLESHINYNMKLNSSQMSAAMQGMGTSAPGIEMSMDGLLKAVTTEILDPLTGAVYSFESESKGKLTMHIATLGADAPIEMESSITLQRISPQP